MRQCAGKLGIDVGHGTFTDLDYLDDGALFTAHPNNWNEVLTDYEAGANTLSLRTNWQKTEVQNITTRPPPDAARWAVRQWSHSPSLRTVQTSILTCIPSWRFADVLVQQTPLWGN